MIIWGSKIRTYQKITFLQGEMEETALKEGNISTSQDQ
jgi:hypothetical protein